jgi:hypothetical protein
LFVASGPPNQFHCSGHCSEPIALHLNASGSPKVVVFDIFLVITFSTCAKKERKKKKKKEKRKHSN